ncbi:SNAP receptor [Martiniozyma asiatica (nom. inval.)]|nr:SNAP receptor [Martiniozyma asiatica]
MDSTIIFHYSSGTPLCATREDTSPHLAAAKGQVKQLVKQQRFSPPLGAISDTQWTIHYLFEAELLFVAITSSNVEEQLAQAYLSDVSKEFVHIHGAALHDVTPTPYQFMSFESFLSKTAPLFNDARGISKMNGLQTQLNEVKGIMNQNISDLLNRGEDLNGLRELSGSLKLQTQKYKKLAVKINWDLMVRKYAGYALVGLVLAWLFWSFF